MHLALIWLLLLPAIDLALFAWASLNLATVAGSGFGLQAAFDYASRLFFWAGSYLVAQVTLDLADRLGVRTARSILLLLARCALAGAHLYFLSMWAFIVSNGHLPSPDAIDFLADNLARLPQHVLQTTPLLAISGLALAIVLARVTEIAIGRFPLSTLQVRRPGAALAALLLLSSSMVTSGVDLQASALAPARISADDQIPHTVAYLEALAPKSAVPPPAVPTRKYPVIVILVESLRYDLLSKHPEAIPFLKSLHESQLGFEKAYATASHSNLTDLAFWYSQYPLRGKGHETYPVDAPWRGTSMFHAFKEAGYPTAYVSSQNERWGNMINWLKTDDIDYFFDSENYAGETWENFDDLAGLGGMIKRGLVTAGKVEDSKTLEIAQGWIESLGKGNAGFFLGMNLQNTHFSYVMPPQGVEPYQPSDIGFKAIYYRWPEEKKDHVRNRYLNAVTNVDHLLKTFADRLKAKGLWEDCIFVVVGDNGEGFYEHGFGNHSGPMYDEAVRTFSVVKLPARLRQMPRLVTAPVSHIDIAATIPAIAGIPLPQSFQGVPLYPPSEPQRPVFMYSNAIVRQFGMVSWPWKLLVTEFPESRQELFNLEVDPAESVNLWETHSAVAKELSGQLVFWGNVQREYYRRGIYAEKSPPRYTLSARDLPAIDTQLTGR